MSDLVKRLRNIKAGSTYSRCRSEAADRIEQLERELAECHGAHEHTSFMLGAKLSDLTAERELSTKLAAQLFSYMTTEYWSDGDACVIEAYRKARGM